MSDTDHTSDLIPGKGSSHADALVREGLWEETDTGWFIRSFLKWNPSLATQAEAKAQRRKGAANTNHKRGLHARDNARTEVERLTALLAEVRATAEHYNGQAYANCSAAILRILDGERIKHWHDLRPGETVCTDCWLVHPDGACDR